VPTVGKWSNGASDMLLLYVTRSDGHLWELWYPNPDGTGSWGNVSSSLGYGNIVGSPAIADSDGTGRVSVAARVGAELHTFDWYSGAWHARPVLWGAAPVRSSSYMNSNYETSVPYLSGRANLPDGSADVGWVATRSSWTTNFTVVPAGALDTVGVPGLGGGLGSSPTKWDPSVRVVQVRGGWLFHSDPTSSSWEDASLYGCAGPHGFTTNRRNPAAGATNHLYGSQGGNLLSVEANPGGYGDCGFYAESGTVASGVAPTIDGQTSIWPATSYGAFVFYTGDDGTLQAFNTSTTVLQGLALSPLLQSD